jgi:O-acetyl-ADP-ribose deacetylase (regulator of RNase III)
MKMLKTIKGDLVQMAKDGDFDVILHGCNCFNTMGAGIAAQIAVKCPDARLADDETVRGDPGKLGTYSIGVDTALVLNCYTQFGTAKHGDMDVFEYTAFERVLSKIVHRFGEYSIGLPLIGMGLAGGDKTRIMPMIEAFAQRVTEKGGSVTLVEWERK